MAFSDIENNEKLDIIDIAIIDNEEFQNNAIFKQTFEALGDKNEENQMFNIKYVDEEEAKKLLENSEISGYINFEKEEPKIIVATNGINETILKYTVEEIIQNTKVISEITESEIRQESITANTNIDYEKIYEEATKLIQNQDINIKDISSQKLSYTMIEYYTLIAMTCLFGGILSMEATKNSLANMSEKGKRIAISPTSKIKVVLSSLLASYIVQLIGLAILFVFTIFILNVDYGNNLGLIILLGITGSLAGLSLGVAITVLLKCNENAKSGILTTITMIGVFLSGMMGITTKYVIDTNIPILNKINPASMITDGFYSLYYYDTLDRYIFNVISLVVFSGIMIFLSFRVLKKQKYESI